MALCEMCGKEAGLVEADVEGVELNVCSGCLKFGTVKKKAENSVSSFSVSRSFIGRSSDSRSFYHKSVGGGEQNKKAEQEFKTVSNYSQLIKSAREKRGLKQEDFAKFLNEKESLVAKWESGLMKPSLDTAKRLERMLGIKLVESEVVGSFEQKVNKNADEFTLGDFIKVRKRKQP